MAGQWVVARQSNGARGLKHFLRIGQFFNGYVARQSNGARGLKLKDGKPVYIADDGRAPIKWRAWIETNIVPAKFPHGLVARQSNGARGLKHVSCAGRQRIAWSRANQMARVD